MTIACPHCSSPGCVRNGYGNPAAWFLDGARVSERRIRVTRVLCRSCGKAGTVRDPGDVHEEARLLNHLADRTFALGQEGASAETGMPTTTLQSHLAAWSRMREDDVLDAAPDSLLLEPVILRNAERLLVIDCERRSLVEILRDEAALIAWLDAPTRAPALRACIPLDARISAVLARHVPSTRILVSGETMARALKGAAALGIAALRRRPDMQGRNAMPTHEEFQDYLAVSGTAHLGWPSEASNLLACTRLALEMAASPDREAAERLWDEFAILASLPAARRIGVLMETWREPLLEGLAFGDIHRAAPEATSLGRALEERRPTLGFQDVRSFALLRDFERRVEGPLYPGHRPSAVAVGVDVRGLLERLAA